MRFAPDLSLANKRDLPKKIREGFIDNIGPNATGAGREFRRNLINFEGDNNPTGAALNKFEVACADRDILEATTDVMMLASLLRSKARELEIMEFSGTLAFDAFEPSHGAGSTINPKSRLSPNTCEVVTRFVGVAEPVDDE